MKNIHTVARVEKIKSWSQMKNTERHNNRTMKVENADENRDAIRIKGSDNLVNDVKSIMLKYKVDIKKLRKDAVLANELVFSLSKEFFTDKELDYKNKFNKERIRAFYKILVKHLEEKFGDKVANVCIHLDESNVHSHVVIVPIIGESRLSARDFFNRKALIELQKDYCNAFNTSDLKSEFKFSYTENSKATHQTVNEFYKKANKAKENEEKIENLEREIVKLKSNKNNSEEFIELQTQNKKLKKDYELTRFKLEKTELLVIEKEEKISLLSSMLDSLKLFIKTFASDKLKYLSKSLLKSLNIESDRETDCDLSPRLVPIS
ncbi:MobV family relaxase [Shewanella algae]|uniref:MobV family relaxase n=1 Tax=Shewanella algae TaxID=38313 RepID=UPI003004F6EE